MTRVSIALLLSTAVSVAAAPGGALAQCPDGTPPPCGARAHVARVAPPTSAERGRRFLILPFRNLTRAADQEWLVEGATTMLAEFLSRWHEIRVVPDEQLYPALRRAGLVVGSIMDLARIRRVADETDGWTAVTGEVLATGGRVRVSARAFDVVTNRELVRASAQEVPSGGDVRAAFERIAASLLPAAGLQADPADPGAATTHSLDAYRAYLRGVAQVHRSHYRQARDALLEAVRLDSTFAQAYVLLAECALFINPLVLFDPQSPGHRYAARAAELSGELSPARRGIALAVEAMFLGQVTAARDALERVVAADSNDVNALGLLGLLEWGDPILVPAGAGERPRGSLNRSNRLVKRVLALNPDNHAAYLPLTLSHSYAGGDLPGLVVGVRREGASFRDMMLGGMPRVFVTIYQADSIALVPAESLAFWPADSLVQARRRGLAVARAWSDRWLAVGREEGEAHLTAARVAHRQGELLRALAELDTAYALGVESGITAPAYMRLTLLGELGRYDAARARADSMLADGRFDDLLPLPSEWMEAEAWAFNLWLMHGDFAHAATVMDRVAASLRTAGILRDSAMANAIALPLVSGASVPPFWLVGLPARFRADVMDSVWARRALIPAGSLVERGLPTLARMVGAAAAPDSALAARVRAAPWYRPAQ